MSCKPQRILISTVKSLMRKDASKGTMYVMKKNVSCSNVLSSRNFLSLQKNTQLHGLLYECRVFYVTSAEDIKKNTSGNSDKKLVYYGLLTSKIKGLKVVSYSTSLISLIAQPMIYEKVIALAAPAMAALYTVMGFFTFVTPFLIHSVTKKYITEIKYDESQDIYILQTMTFFLQNKIDSFKLEDIKFNDSAGLFNVFTIKGKPYMLFEEGFLDREQYIKLLGFDKPIDLHLNEDPDDPVEPESRTVKSAAEK